jgi:uncharacterized SAM-binding protein YcdF (DUF218 family)/lysophospholipase L1-like esterase
MLPRRRRFIAGVLCGVLLVFAGRLAINHTPFADWIIAPLLTEDSPDGEPADAIVALGAGVIGECWPNHYGESRALLASRLWRERRAPIVLFTGGTDAGCPAATAMATLAHDAGLPRSSVVMETFADNTRENAERSTPLLRDLGARRILLVTDRLHMRRAEASFERMGFTVQRASVPIYIGHEDNVAMLRAGIREYLALMYYRLRGWTAPAPRSSEELRTVSPARGDIANPGGPIVVLGASYARGWTLPDVAGTTIVNQGRAGERSDQMQARFESDVVAERPRAVVIWGFVNDLTQADLRDAEPVLARIRESYTRMLRQARDAGIEPIVATEVSLGEHDSWRNTIFGWIGAIRGKTSYQDLVNGHLAAINQWLTGMARQEGLLVLDLNAVLAGNQGRRRAEFVGEDGSHLTEEAYRALTEYGQPILERHFGGSTSADDRR